LYGNLIMPNFINLQIGLKRKQPTVDSKEVPPAKVQRLSNIKWAKKLKDFVFLKFLGEGGFGKVRT